MPKLNLGAGTDIQEGYINHDQHKLKGIDVVFNLNDMVYPYTKEYFHEIRCVAVLEHTKDICKTIQELHRILKFGGKLVIEQFPHFTCSNSFADPTHRYFGAYGFFDLFKEGHKENYYAGCSFFDVSKKIVFGKRLALWNYLIEPLANLFPQVWENTFLRNLFPAESISVVMIK
jgi:ubiquinone/menaquinone biosynthesis C-methylase UbiE